MIALLPIHIVGGSIAIIAGFIALYAFKGAKLHRQSGMIFVYGMLVLSLTGATIAVIKSQPANIIGGSIAFYLVMTGWLTLRNHDDGSRLLYAASALFAIGLAVLSTTLAFQVANSPAGTIDGVPPAPLFAFGVVASLAALGDIRVMVARGVQGRQRIVRHLWRMCFAMFIASGSFFLGQAKVIPKPIRIFPLLAIPAFLPLVLLAYWLVRVQFTKWYRRRAGSLVIAS
jgi:hypothetical protein